MKLLLVISFSVFSTIGFTSLPSFNHNEKVIDGDENFEKLLAAYNSGRDVLHSDLYMGHKYRCISAKKMGTHILRGRGWF